MSVAHRIESLMNQHAEIEANLHQEEVHVWHDESKIVRLKQSKLRLKDQIQRLKAAELGQRDQIRCRSDTG